MFGLGIARDIMNSPEGKEEKDDKEDKVGDVLAKIFLWGLFFAGIGLSVYLIKLQGIFGPVGIFLLVLLVGLAFIFNQEE